MLTYLHLHQQNITQKLSQKGTKWDRLYLSHLRVIADLQHERLIHLLVTLTVGIVAVIFFITSIALHLTYLYLITFILLSLLVCYLIYYFKLENGIQSLYSLTEKIEEKLS